MEVGGQIRCPGYCSIKDNVQVGNDGWVCLRVSEQYEGEKSVLSLPEIEPQFLYRPYRYAIFIQTDVTRLLKWYLT